MSYMNSNGAGVAVDAIPARHMLPPSAAQQRPTSLVPNQYGLAQDQSAPFMSGGSRFKCVEVWAENLEEEMAMVREVVAKYPYCAMDTEFPGVVVRPVGNLTQSQFTYQSLRCNVDLLRIIQLGLSFSDADGQAPPDVCTWQFNFQFNVHEDMSNQGSIDLLIRSGIDFKAHRERGIDVVKFAELMMVSGLVLCDEVKWISFHGGYDFGYLLQLLTTVNMPEDEEGFYDHLKLYFPCVYDIKYLMKSCKALKGGLQDVADDLEVERIGPQHQAGSDSLLTLNVFFKMSRAYFDNKIDEGKYMGHLHGILTK